MRRLKKEKLSMPCNNLDKDKANIDYTLKNNINDLAETNVTADTTAREMEPCAINSNVLTVDESTTKFDVLKEPQTDSSIVSENPAEKIHEEMGISVHEFGDEKIYALTEEAKRWAAGKIARIKVESANLKSTKVKFHEGELITCSICHGNTDRHKCIIKKNVNSDEKQNTAECYLDSKPEFEDALSETNETEDVPSTINEPEQYSNTHVEEPSSESYNEAFLNFLKSISNEDSLQLKRAIANIKNNHINQEIEEEHEKNVIDIFDKQINSVNLDNEILESSKDQYSEFRCIQNDKISIDSDIDELIDNMNDDNEVSTNSDTDNRSSDSNELIENHDRFSNETEISVSELGQNSGEIFQNKMLEISEANICEVESMWETTDPFINFEPAEVAQIKIIESAFEFNSTKYSNTIDNINDLQFEETSFSNSILNNSKTIKNSEQMNMHSNNYYNENNKTSISHEKQTKTVASKYINDREKSNEKDILEKLCRDFVEEISSDMNDFCNESLVNTNQAFNMEVLHTENKNLVQAPDKDLSLTSQDEINLLSKLLSCDYPDGTSKYSALEGTTMSQQTPQQQFTWTNFGMGNEKNGNKSIPEIKFSQENSTDELETIEILKLPSKSLLTNSHLNLQTNVKVAWSEEGNTANHYNIQPIESNQLERNKLLNRRSSLKNALPSDTLPCRASQNHSEINEFKKESAKTMNTIMTSEIDSIVYEELSGTHIKNHIRPGMFPQIEQNNLIPEYLNELEDLGYVIKSATTHQLEDNKEVKAPVTTSKELLDLESVLDNSISSWKPPNTRTIVYTSSAARTLDDMQIKKT